MAEEQSVSVGRGSLGEALGAALCSVVVSAPKEAHKEADVTAAEPIAAEVKLADAKADAGTAAPAQGARPPREPRPPRTGAPGGQQANAPGGQQGNRAGGGNRPPREGGNRPQGDRPQGDRPHGDRPQGGGGRSGGDRPGGDRPGGDRPGGDRRDFRPGGGDRTGGERRDFAPDIEIEKLISDSLYLDNQAHVVVSRMRDMDSGTRSQLRRLYSAVRRATRAPENERQHEFVMLRARLAYTIARHGLRSLDQLERLLLQVTRKNEARGYERFRDLFEAIVAYNE